MSWHGVPYRTLLQLSNTHLQLAGTNTGYTVDNQLVDYAVVALLQATSLDVVGILQGNLLGRICLMSTSAVHIELSWLSCILAAYLDILGTTTYVESLLETECILLAVNGNSTLATDVDDTQLAVVDAARYGYIDDVIEPRNTRFRVIRALQSLATKRLQNPAKKHSNIPL